MKFVTNGYIGKGKSISSKTRPKILQPTRITSNPKAHIENIFLCFISHKITFGNITATLYDHLPQFLFVPKVLPILPAKNLNS